MCQAVSEGGRRCPVHQHQNIAAIRAAEHLSGLTRLQTERLFAELRREGRAAEPMTNQLHAGSIRRIRNSVEGTDVNEAVTADLERSAAHDPQIDPASAYAQRVLLSRAQERQANLNKRFRQVADRTGYSTQEVAAKYKEFRKDVDTSRGSAVPPEYDQNTRRAAVIANLPYDRASIVALEKLKTMQPVQETRRVVLTPGNDIRIKAFGYDDGRIEFVFHATPGEIHAYHNVPPAVWEEIKNSSNVYYSFIHNIRSQDEYMYDSKEAAEADAHRVQCGACGQFRAASHSCPERIVRENLSLTEMTAEEVVEAVETPPVASVTPSELVSEPEQPHAQPQPEPTPVPRPAARPSRLLTTALANRGDVVVIEPEDSDEEAYVSFGKDIAQSLNTTNDDVKYMSPGANRLIVPEHMNVDLGTLSHQEVLNRIKYNTYARSMMRIKVPKPTSAVKAALKKSDVEIPVSVTFDLTQSEGGQAKVDGSIKYKKTDDITSAEVESSDLKCSCADYAANYDCLHVRVVKDQHVALLGAGTRQEATGEQSLLLHSIKNSEHLSTAQMIQAEMTRGDLTYEEVLALREERAFALVERQRERRARELEFYAKGLKEGKKWHKETNQEATKNFGNYRKDMLKRWKNVEEPYSDNPKAFYEDYKSALSRKRAGEEPIPFRTENVTDGICADEPGARSFGIELEFDIDETNFNRYEALQKIGEELHEAGLTRTPEQEEYHTAAESGWDSWSFEEDCTVSGELVSPIMKDTPEHWEQLRVATEIITRNGGVATARTGSHVHVSTGSYQHSTAKHAELLRTVNDNEDLMYRLATNPKTGVHRRGQWCQPNENDEGADFISPEIEAGHRVLGNNEEHMYALNFEGSSNVDYRKSHTEFRMWDGTLDPAVIQQQVMISAAITDHAERKVLANKGSARPKPEDRKVIGKGRDKDKEILTKASTKTHTEETFAESSVEAAAFLDKLFRRREDRATAASLFAVTTWQA
jgi:hypothetical protein